MEKIPTAEEFWLNSYFSDSISQEDKEMWLEYNNQAKESIKIMIEFAKLHVEAALKVASENASLKVAEGRFDLPDYVEEGINATVDDLDNAYYIDRNLILRSYPLENIK